MATEVTKRPSTALAGLRDRFDRLFDEVVHARRDDGSWPMAMDVHQTDDALVLQVDAPGMEPDEVKITVEDGVLTISGEHEESSEKAEDGYVRRERRFGSFRRTQSLPIEAEADRIEAKVKNGVVEITVPLGAKPESDRIEITPTAS